MINLSQVVGDIVSKRYVNYGVGTSTDKQNLILIKDGSVLGIITIDGEFRQSPGHLMDKRDCLVVWYATDLVTFYSLIIKKEGK